jgi:hypothetical protein
MIQTPGTDMAVLEDGRRIGASISSYEKKVGPFSFGHRYRISVTGDVVFNKDIRTERIEEVAIDPALGVVYAIGRSYKSGYNGRRDDTVDLYAVDLATGRTEKTPLGELSYDSFSPDFFKGRDGHKPFFLEYGPYELLDDNRRAKDFRPLKVINPGEKTRRQVSGRTLNPNISGFGREISVIVPASEMRDLVFAGRCSESAVNVFIWKDIDKVNELNNRLAGSYLGSMFNIPKDEFENVCLEGLRLGQSLDSDDAYPRYRVSFDPSGNVVSAERLPVTDAENIFRDSGKTRRFLKE